MSNMKILKNLFKNYCKKKINNNNFRNKTKKSKKM